MSPFFKFVSERDKLLYYTHAIHYLLYQGHAQANLFEEVCLALSGNSLED